MSSTHAGPLPREHGGQPGRSATSMSAAEQGLDEAGRDLEHRYRQTFDDAPIGMAMVADGGDYLRVNRAYASLVGCTVMELVSGRFLDNVHRDDRAACTEAEARLHRGEVSQVDLTGRIVRRDGTEVPAVVHLAAVRGESGNTPHYVVQVVDMTEQHRARTERDRLLAEIEAERRLLAGIFRACPSPLIAVVLDDGERIRANPQAIKLLGVDLEAAQDRHAYTGVFCHPDGTAIEFDALPSSRALKGESTHGQEVLVRRPDGTEQWILAGAEPLRAADGAVTGAVLTAEDVSPLKALERLRDEWTVLIAHDLRQPITTIGLLAGNLQRAPTTDLAAAVLRTAENIQVAARRLDRMINDLLDVSRLDSHGLKISQSPVDLARLVPAVFERAADMFAGCPVRLRVECRTPVTVWADAIRIEQVLVNLLSNACKYGHAGSPIEVTLTRRGADVELAVTNEGPEIPPCERALLFSRFYRTHAASRGDRPGLGLGLYIVRGLVEAHGGHVDVGYDNGKTTFWITLPSAPRA